MKYTLKIFKDGKVVRSTFTRFRQRFAYFLRTINFQNCDLVYIRVNYEDGLHNDGEYTNKKDLMQAFRAFIEK